LAEWWSGSKVILYADPKVVSTYFGKEHAQLLLNHCYEVDWLLGWLICDRVKILGVRVFLK
jgi:lysophosphatidic acid acyltransferase/lysophosphatidylinositol acyltransferase